jgi:hypothetical protein
VTRISEAATNAGSLISGGGSNNQIQIACNIRQLPQFVNVSFPAKSRQGWRVISLTNGGLFWPATAKFRWIELIDALYLNRVVA